MTEMIWATPKMAIAIGRPEFMEPHFESDALPQGITVVGPRRIGCKLPVEPVAVDPPAFDNLRPIKQAFDKRPRRSGERMDKEFEEGGLIGTEANIIGKPTRHTPSKQPFAEMGPAELVGGNRESELDESAIPIGINGFQTGCVVHRPRRAGSLDFGREHQMLQSPGPAVKGGVSPDRL
jgi:hypothetical protein